MSVVEPPAPPPDELRRAIEEESQNLIAILTVASQLLQEDVEAIARKTRLPRDIIVTAIYAEARRQILIQHQ